MLSGSHGGNPPGAMLSSGSWRPTSAPAHPGKGGSGTWRAGDPSGEVIMHGFFMFLIHYVRLAHHTQR